MQEIYTVLDYIWLPASPILYDLKILSQVHCNKSILCIPDVQLSTYQISSKMKKWEIHIYSLTLSFMFVGLVELHSSIFDRLNYLHILPIPIVCVLDLCQYWLGCYQTLYPMIRKSDFCQSCRYSINIISMWLETCWFSSCSEDTN